MCNSLQFFSAAVVVVRCSFDETICGGNFNGTVINDGWSRVDLSQNFSSMMLLSLKQLFVLFIIYVMNTYKMSLVFSMPRTANAI